MSSSSSNNNVEQIRLTYKEKVPIIAMKEIISTCLKEKLTGAIYDGINHYDHDHDHYHYY